jgi:hypothetical protein
MSNSVADDRSAVLGNHNVNRMTATWPSVGDNLTTKDTWTAGNTWSFRAAGWQTDAHFIGAAAAWVPNTQFGHDWGWWTTWLTAGIKTATASCGRIGSHGGQHPTGDHHGGQSNSCVEADHLLHLPGTLAPQSPGSPVCLD